MNLPVDLVALPPDASEYCLIPDSRTPNWSETRWITAFDTVEGVGIFFHAGRVPDDLGVWWAHCVAYLPGGELVVNRSWGRPNDTRVCGTGSVTLTMQEPWRRWQLSFDGAGQQTTPAAAARGPVGGGWPAVPMRWNLTGLAAAPPWDALAGKDTTWSAAHYEQAYTVSGQIHVGDKIYNVDGFGGTDHSHGPRSWHNFAAHNFILGVMPDYVFHTIQVWDPSDAPSQYLGAMFTAKGQTPLAGVDFPRLSDLSAPDEQFDVLIVPAEGADPIRLRAEVLHGVATTNTLDRDCIIGVDWDADPVPYLPVESIIRLTAPDGTVGYGHTERSRLRTDFDRHTGRLNKPDATDFGRDT